MTEDTLILQSKVSYYGQLMKVDLDEKPRAILTRLLADAKRELAAAIERSPQTDTTKSAEILNFPARGVASEPPPAPRNANPA